MDKDEQAPGVVPKAPEPAAPKAEPVNAPVTAPKVEPTPAEAPKVESAPAEAPKAPEPAAPKVTPEAPKETTATPVTPAEVEAPKKEPEAPKTEPVSAPVAEEPKAEPTTANDVAAEMDRLLKESSAEDKHKPEPQLMFGKKHNHVGIIIFLSLLVLAAVGFAIFEYMTTQNAATCECQKCEQAECDCEEESISKDYLYISEWGIKIKIPKGLDHVGYSFGSTTNDVLYISGIKSGLSETERNSVDAIGTFFKGGIMLARQTVEKNNNCSSGEETELDMSCALAQYPVAYSTDEYVYMYNEDLEEPLWTDGANESLTSIEQDTIQLIIDMLSNQENYSEF